MSDKIGYPPFFQPTTQWDPGFPGQINSIASQLGRGYGGSNAGMMDYLTQMYQPMFSNAAPAAPKRSSSSGSGGNYAAPPPPKNEYIAPHSRGFGLTNAWMTDGQFNSMDDLGNFINQDPQTLSQRQKGIQKFFSNFNVDDFGDR